ncbi:hypothetical protein ABVT39_014926 [Epinephelus coioides]
MSKTMDIGHLVDPSHQNGGRMTTPDERQKEIRSVKEDLLGPKPKICLGTLNVRTIYETTKTAQVPGEIKRYHLDILWISERHWTGSGRQVLHVGSVIFQ